MITPEITNIIGSIGFPIFMCLVFIFRTEKVIKANTEVLYLIKNKLKG